VADFLMFTEGKNEMMSNGLPGTCYFLLSSRQIGAGGTPLAAASTLAGGVGEITGTGYARQSQSEPTPSSGSAVFTLMSYATGAAVDWPAAVYSLILATTSNNTGKAICAWHLVTGGTARDMSAASTTENVTPTLTLT
jgi:hypothetical protein